MGIYFTGLIYSKSDGKENYKAWSTVTTTALADSAISNWPYNAVQGMIDEMIEDKITQDLQCFQSSLANSPHNDILWTCLVFLAASRQVWSIYWIIPPGLTVHILS